jgi:hypothetical protein
MEYQHGKFSLKRERHKLLMEAETLLLRLDLRPCQMLLSLLLVELHLPQLPSLLSLLNLPTLVNLLFLHVPMLDLLLLLLVPELLHAQVLLHLLLDLPTKLLTLLTP